MRRRHMFELEDQRWFPACVRNIITDFLREVLVVGGRVYAPAVPLLVRVLDRSGTDRIVDLCSGASGPWTHLKAELDAAGAPVSLLLTDKFPHTAALARAVAEIGDTNVKFERTSVDATDVPGHLDGIRTLFTSFHHFRPRVARGVVRDAYERRAGIAVFEFTERTLSAVLRTLFMAPLLVVLSTPRLRPSLGQLVLTYLIPILPVAVTWDGIVSNLRTYTPAELRQLVIGLDADDYAWEAGQIPGDGRTPPVTYLLGYPNDRKEAK